MYEALALHPNDQRVIRLMGKSYFWTHENGKLKLNPAVVGKELHPVLLDRLAEMN